MLSLVLVRIAIALVLCSQVSTLRQDTRVVSKNLVGKHVRLVEDGEGELEVTTSHYVTSKNESKFKDDVNNDYLKRKSYEGEEVEAKFKEDDNERLGKRINDPNGILPEFSIPIGNVTATLGRDARLICTVEHLGQYQVAWLKVETNTILSIDTNIITSNYRMFLIPDEEERKWVLHIKDVQLSDRGLYQCQVNTVPVRSISGYLEVLVPPTIVESLTSQAVDVIEHSNAIIQCIADGHPKVSISWRRDDGLPIKLKGIGSPDPEKQLELKYVIGIETPLNEVSSETLSLRQVDRSMAGVYVCIASNGITTQANKRIPLYVRYPPKTSLQMSSYTVPLGEQLEVDCTIEAFPKANNFWLKKVDKSDQNQVPKRRDLISASKKSSNLKQVADPLQSNYTNSVRPKRQSSSLQNATKSIGLVSSQDNQLQSSNVQLTYPKLSLDPTTTTTVKPIKKLRDSAVQEAEIAPIIKSASKIVRQTVINSFTYKLKLVFLKVAPDDYGEYICASSNSLGNSTTTFALLKMPTEVLKVQTTNSIDPRQKHQAESNESNLAGQDMKAFPKSGKLVNQKTSIRRNGNHVYDENYLQTIKSRQGNRSRAVKLRHRGKNSASILTEASNSFLLLLSTAFFLLLQMPKPRQTLIN